MILVRLTRSPLSLFAAVAGTSRRARDTPWRRSNSTASSKGAWLASGDSRAVTPLGIRSRPRAATAVSMNAPRFPRYATMEKVCAGRPASLGSAPVSELPRPRRQPQQAAAPPVRPRHHHSVRRARSDDRRRAGPGGPVCRERTPAEHRVVVESDEVRAEFSTRGAVF